MIKLLSLITLALCLSGCLSDSSPASSAVASTIADGGGSGTAGSDTGSALAFACVDPAGKGHNEGDIWSTSVDSTFVACGTTENYSQQVVTKSYLCRDSSIWMTSELIKSKQADPTCPAPELNANITSGVLFVSSTNLTNVTYTCVNTVSGATVLSGNLVVSPQNVALDTTLNLNCTLQGQMVDGNTLTVAVAQDGSCGNKIKVNGVCQDFACKQILAIAPNAQGLIQVPARSSDGMCYAIKVFSAIANSASSLTTAIDTDVISRNHDVSYANASSSNVHNPYLMGKALINFEALGARTVKLAGSGDSLAPILVDNFILSGIYPLGTAPSTSVYRAYGTSDSAIGVTGDVSLLGEPVPVKAFATGGTSTVAPLDITTDVQVNLPYTLDVRAEDCGGSRQLSDLYLVFQ